MKRLNLLPKTFLYTLVLMVFVVATARILIYLLVPQRVMEITIADTVTNTAEIITVGNSEEKIVMQAIQSALPLSLILCTADRADGRH
ncbi:MAG: hypothetical protein HFI24_03975 [Lachnospiraceae bacterium]|nr:hypothetical protein [Lachnospiraceae bacterium]